ncbi:unnamed protein product [Cladocopium goreaui]|uniref:Uncharacterized protein n=1 Tax=Cladocopium goreaui TaxID=2562237 RepID=A0A9P1DAW7_9DINO|nr:unnamed protein product [Cladocopium goreaui]
MAALPDENARLSPAVEEAEWPHSPTPSTKAKAEEQSPFPPTQKAPPTPNSSPTQGSGQGSPAAEGPALASSHWGFNIKRAKVPGQGAGASEPVQSSLADLRTCAAYTLAASGRATSMDQVNQVLWDKTLFKHIEDVDSLYGYVHSMLDRAHSEEERNHRDLSADPDYDGSRNFPAPFYKASQRLCLKNGWHLGSFLLSMQNNIAYCEHRCTKLTPEVAKSERSFEEAPIFERVATSADQNDEELQWPKRGITSKKLRREQVEQAIVDELPDLSSGWTVAELMRAIEKSLELRAEELTKHKGLIEAILDRRQHQELEDAIGLCMDTAEEEGNSLRGVHDDQFLAALRAHLNFPPAAFSKCTEEALQIWKQRKEAMETAVPEVVAADYVHEISPAIMVVLGGAASSRKSPNNAFAVHMIQNSKNADTTMKDSYLVEATLKGCRTSILNNGGFACVSDELSNTLQTPWSDHSAGINFLSKSKLNTFSQAEHDSVVTAAGRMCLNSYKTMVKLWGQLEAAEWVLRPTPNGFPKRCSVAWSPDRNPVDPDVAAGMSTGFIAQLHDFALGFPGARPSRCGPDEYAATILQTVRRAVHDWLDEHHVDSNLSAKLGFVGTDMLRYAQVNMRIAQYCEMAAAFWQWERQVFLVCGYLRYIRGLERNLGLNDRDRSICGLAAGMLHADAPVNYKQQALETAEDKLKHDILSCPKARGEFTSALMREELRHKHRKAKDFKSMLLKAIDGLVAHGLLLCDKDPRKEMRPKKKRRKNQAAQGAEEPEAAADAPAAGEQKEVAASRVVLSLRKPALAELTEEAEAERLKMSNTVQKWALKFPRKPKASAQPTKGKKSSQSPSLLLPTPRSSRTDDGAEGQQPAAAPADFEQTPKNERLPEKHCQSLEQLAGRLACGRTSSVLLSILGTHPFKRSAPESLPTLTSNAPCRRMTATLQGSMVFVLDTFTRRGKLHADIANVRRRADQDWTLGSISTVKADCLTDFRVELVVTAVSGTQVRLERLCSTQLGGALTLVPALPTAAVQQPIDTAHPDAHVFPAAAQAHAERHGHKIIPMRDRAGTEVILDIPNCKSFTHCPYRCLTCKQNSKASNSEPSYFNFTDEDVRQTFPHLCIVRTPKEKKHYMTKRYLLEVLLQFYCKLNCREVRRSLMDICCANSLQANLLQQAQAVPKSKVLRHVVVQAFGRCLDDIVDSFQQKLFLYNAQGIRHDGNMGLARTIEQSVPVFHATDNYRGQRFRLAARYHASWPELRLQSFARTRKGDAERRSVIPVKEMEQGCTIVGDPQHDIINLSKLLHGRAADKDDLLRDHCDLMHRLSGPQPPNLKSDPVPTIYTELSEAAACLLRSACVDPQPEFREKKAKYAEAMGELKAFLGLPHVQLSPTWKDIMGSLPPRGTLVRVANRVEASLHATSQGFGWTSPQAFRREARRIIRWYRKGKKTMRYNRSLPRTQHAPEYVRGLKTCWTQKVALHYRRFFGKIRQEGLWSWRLMSKAMRLAKLSQQSGTVSVERVWSYYLAEFPHANRGMTLEYFNVMSALLFLRFNLRHFKAHRLPGWLENDALVATKLDAILALARSQEPETDLHDFGSIFSSLRCSDDQ